MGDITFYEDFEDPQLELFDEFQDVLLKWNNTKYPKTAKSPFRTTRPRSRDQYAPLRTAAGISRPQCGSQFRSSTAVPGSRMEANRNGSHWEESDDSSGENADAMVADYFDEYLGINRLSQGSRQSAFVPNPYDEDDFTRPRSRQGSFGASYLPQRSRHMGSRTHRPQTKKRGWQHRHYYFTGQSDTLSPRELRIARKRLTSTALEIYTLKQAAKDRPVSRSSASSRNVAADLMSTARPASSGATQYSGGSERPDFVVHPQLHCQTPLCQPSRTTTPIPPAQQPNNSNCWHLLLFANYEDHPDARIRWGKPNKPWMKLKIILKKKDKDDDEDVVEDTWDDLAERLKSQYWNKIERQYHTTVREQMRYELCMWNSDTGACLTSVAQLSDKLEVTVGQAGTPFIYSLTFKEKKERGLLLQATASLTLPPMQETDIDDPAHRLVRRPLPPRSPSPEKADRVALSEKLLLQLQAQLPYSPALAAIRSPHRYGRSPKQAFAPSCDADRQGLNSRSNLTPVSYDPNSARKNAQQVKQQTEAEGLQRKPRGAVKSNKAPGVRQVVAQIATKETKALPVGQSNKKVPKNKQNKKVTVLQKWHYADQAGKFCGPFSKQEMQNLLQDGTIISETMCFCPDTDMSDWQPASDIGHLLDLNERQENELRNKKQEREQKEKEQRQADEKEREEKDKKMREQQIEQEKILKEKVQKEKEQKEKEMAQREKEQKEKAQREKEQKEKTQREKEQKDTEAKQKEEKAKKTAKQNCKEEANSSEAEGGFPDQWHYADEKGAFQGPFSKDELKKLFKSGTISLKTLAFCPNSPMQEWTAIEHISSLCLFVLGWPDCWHYADKDGNFLGPLSLSSMNKLLSDETITEFTLVFCPDSTMSEWQQIRNLPQGIRQLFNAIS